MIRPSLARLIAGLLLGSLAAAALHAGDHGIQMQAISPWSDPTGYTPVVVTVDATREAELDLLINGQGGGARATIRVGEGKPARQTILLPPSNGDWVRYHRVEWLGPGGISGGVQISGVGHQQIRCVLIDPKQQVIEDDLENALSSIIGSGGSSRKDVVMRIDPGDLPDRWQGYPEWLVLVLTPQGHAGLVEAQRQAIAAWTRSGGTLVVTTPELVRDWTARRAEALLDPLVGKPAVLGQALSRQQQLESWRPVDAPVPGTESVPVKTFVVLALAFAIVVGPLNLWWVRRRNARHLFLITTPLLSFATCIVLIVVSLLADGISIRRDAVQVCYLDHRSQQAIRWTGCTYFAAFARSQVELDAQTKVRVLDQDDYVYRHRRSNTDGEQLHIDWRAGQLLSGTVLPARLNRQLSYTEHLPERRRLVVTRSGDGYQVTNGLGVAVLGLVWRDEQGGRWTCRDLAAGEVAILSNTSDQDSRLRLTSGSASAPVFWQLDSLPSGIANRIGRDVSQVYALLRDRPSTFVAVLAAPMDALPGPTADDPEPADVIAFGHLPLGGPAVEAKP